MIFHFRKKVVDNKAALTLYRKCMRVIQQLQPNHQKLWYDYVRLKYDENSSLKDKQKIDKVIAAAYEELSWVQTVLDRKNNKTHQ
jgi:predicted RNA-binding protein with EMAP domain